VACVNGDHNRKCKIGYDKSRWRQNSCWREIDSCSEVAVQSSY
jgi:hypothetical protein